MLFHHQQTRRGKEMEFREEREQAELKLKNPLYKKSMKCEGPERKADYRSFSQVLLLELLFLRNLVRPFLTLFYKERDSRVGMENDYVVEGIKDCFVKEMSVRIGERAREKRKPL